MDQSPPPKIDLNQADAETLAGKLDAGGLRHVRWTLMAGGIIALHSGVR